MRMLTLVAVAAIVILSGCVSTPIPTVADADAVFRTGKFADAKRLYARIAKADAKNVQAATGLGAVALLENDLAAAAEWARRAIAISPDDAAATRVLAYALYRADDFSEAAPVFRKMGNEAVAKKLESFAGIQPYAIEGDALETRLAFVHTDPLPVIQVRVNGSDPVYFIIDTGGSEIYLDPEFAKSAGAVQFGSSTGLYGGGKQAATESGRVDTVNLGDLVVRNVPVAILGTRRFSAAANGKQVDGILGTLMLSRFLATLDFRSGQLVLRRKETPFAPKDAVAMPFWMARDHYIVAWGTVNQSEPLLFFVDTGLAGNGFVCPESTLRDGGITLSGPESEGIGGGGKVKYVPFVLDELTLGGVKAQKVPSVFGAFPPTLEQSEGFRIAGIVSHAFFRPYALTFDFEKMQLLLEK